MAQAKKRVPIFSFGTGKQNLLWNDERKRAKLTPGPLSYNTTLDKILQTTKF